MAEKRMISKSISISEKVNTLPEIFDMLLFTWLIPHSDDFGRLTGSPAKVKALVVPMLDKSIKDIERSLLSLHNAGVIKWYEVKTDRYIQIVNFEKHQTGLHKRTQSKFPIPPEHSEKFPEIPPQGKGTEGNRTEEKGTEQKGREGNGNEAAPPADLESIKTNLHNLINSSDIKQYTLYDLDEIYSYLGMVDVEVIEAAIKKGAGKQSIKYSISTLKGLISEGITKKEQLYSKPEVGQAPNKVTDFSRGRGKPNIPIVSDGPSQAVSAEELEELRKLARKLNGDNGEKEEKGA